MCSPMLNMGKRANDRKSELLEAFANIIRLTRRECADALLIAGDLFENGKPDEKSLDFVCNEFEKISDVRVFISLGNHDYDLKCKFPPNVYVFENHIEKISIQNVDIYGVSFDEEHCERCIIEGFCVDNEENINIMLVHGDVQANSMYNPMTTEAIRYSKVDYMALGHVHSHNGFEKAGATTYSYCGIPEGRAFDECGEKGVVIAEVGKGYAECRFVPVCSRRYVVKNIDISDAEDNLQISQIIASQLSGTENAYRIGLVGNVKTFVDTKFIKDYLEKDYYYIELEDNTESYSDDEYSLKNLFVQNCHNDDALKYGLMALRGEKVIVE